jgi:tRNA-specific 2-thiouridylase
MKFDYQPHLLAEYGITLSAEEYAANAHRTVVVGMSGGVDSSVAALLVKLQGFRTIGLFMKNWDETDENGVCPADADYRDVISVCEQLEIPYYSVNFVQEYWDSVFQEFLSDYRRGFTPNPDILCNREIKFKVFHEKAKLLGADFLATGHYCQLDHTCSPPRLLKGADGNKDQTYFLWAVNGAVLRDVLFPIGHLPKPRVRELARHFGLATSSKKDSTGICFIGERNFKQFLSQYIESQKGNFIDTNGRVLGKHDGTCFYTLGQRKGMGIGGPGEAWFVVGKNHERNEVVLAQGQDHPALYSDGLSATDLNWFGGAPAREFRCQAKIRYRQPEQPCTVTLEGERVRVKFDRPQRAMTQRQSVVFYDGDVCLGGGIIEEIEANYMQRGLGLPEVGSVEV